MTTTDDLEERKKWIRQGWEQVALEYTKDRTGIFERSAKRLLELLQPPMNSALLDVGCGDGVVVREAIKWVGAKGLLIGSDIAGAMVRLGQTTKTQEISNVSFCQMDAEWLVLANASFDSVTCALSLFQFPDMDQALSEMWRVLKPGGCLGLSNWGPGYFSPIAALQRELFRKFKMRSLLTNPLVFQPTELKERLFRMGFTAVEVFEEIEEVIFETPEEVWAFNLDMGPFPIMLQQQLSDDQQSQLEYQFIAMLEDHITEQGIMSEFHLLYAVAEKGG